MLGTFFSSTTVTRIIIPVFIAAVFLVLSFLAISLTYSPSARAQLNAHYHHQA